MSARDLLAKASEGGEESVLVGGGSILVRRAAAHEVISATKYAANGNDEDAYRLALACLSIVDEDGSRPFVGKDGDLTEGIATLRGLPGGTQVDLFGAAMRVNGFRAGN